jgi:MraZ protein
MGARFGGRYEIKIDPKGRFSLPAGLRDALPKRAPRLVITNSLYQNRPCLHAYSAEAWAALEERIARLPALKPEVQAFQRYYLSGGHEIELDAQARVSTPLSLRRHAGLEDGATLVGMGDKFEIWSTAHWRAVNEQLASSFEDTLAAMARLEGDR